MTVLATCPSCDEDVELPDDVEVAEVIVCKNCEHDLEVVSLDPPSLTEWDEEEK